MISSIFWSVGLSFVGWILTRIDLESKLLLPAVVHFRPNQTKLSQTEITQWKVEHLRKFPLQEIGISLFLSLPLSAILFTNFCLHYSQQKKDSRNLSSNCKQKQSQFLAKFEKSLNEIDFAPKIALFSYNFYTHIPPLFKGSSRTTSKSHHGSIERRRTLQKHNPTKLKAVSSAFPYLIFPFSSQSRVSYSLWIYLCWQLHFKTHFLSHLSGVLKTRKQWNEQMLQSILEWDYKTSLITVATRTTQFLDANQTEWDRP